MPCVYSTECIHVLIKKTFVYDGSQTYYFPIVLIETRHPVRAECISYAGHGMSMIIMP